MHMSIHSYTSMHIHKEYICMKHTIAHFWFYSMRTYFVITRFKRHVDSIFSLCPFCAPPFLCLSLCIDHICIDQVLFCCCFCFLQNMQESAGFLCLGAFPPAYLLLCPARFRFLAFEGNGSARSPVNSVRSLSMVGAFRAGLTSISQHSLTQRILSTTPWLCHFEVFWLSFAFFPESCVVHVDDAGLNHRPMLGSKVCAKMPGLPALGSKNCLVSSPGTLFYFFGFSYCHLWQWQLTL